MIGVKTNAYEQLEINAKFYGNDCKYIMTSLINSINIRLQLYDTAYTRPRDRLKNIVWGTRKKT